MANRKAVTLTGTRGGWAARAIAGLLLGALLLPIGAGGILRLFQNNASLLEAFVSAIFCLTGAAGICSIPRCIKHYRHPTVLVMDDDGVQVIDRSETRRWDWSDIVGATTGRGGTFVSLIVQTSSRRKRYIDIGPWPKGTLDEILQQKAAR